ncbi:DUF1513 domain-containing protein [Chitinibacter bivalviorum]|uniref:DUF1513 domain-containing protein n=1 Tax=Chitinibacter bivalviorum TaxID=2739434 RepID=A0A7H9BJS9_9NEIS|nr:DUF1513 domain-containing protein [Chitinibacter bivalviorum]QLG88930.1 DUF1513 domain-containing protein [Chitinibacter bivalviorum]
MINRRHFLQLSALATWPRHAVAGKAGTTSDQAVPTLLSASWSDEVMSAGMISGETYQPIALPGRGHGIVALPASGEAIVVSRRLGSWLAKINWQRGEVVQLREAEFDRHYFGHAILTPDGKTLITTENNDDSSQGLLGIYDVANLKRIAELPTWGIGPHEMIWLVPGKILAIANGGVLTLPETGRAKINRGQMNPSLVLLEWPSGKKLAEYVLEDKALSIRHLARSHDGTIGIALQAEYAKAEQHLNAPLLALLKPNADQLQLAAQAPALQGYGASIAAVHDAQLGSQFLISALRGNQLARWQSDGTPLASLNLLRPAGIASDGKQAWISSETGVLAHYQMGGDTLTMCPMQGTPRWDNHLVLVKN